MTPNVAPTRVFKPWRDVSLAGKFILLVVGFTALVLTVMTVVTYRAQSRIYTTNLIDKSADLARFVSSISPEPIFAKDLVVLDSFVKELSKAQDIVYVVIFAQDGNPLTIHLESENPYIIEATEHAKGHKFADRLDYLRDHPDIITTRHTIDANGQTIGTVEIGASRARINQTLRGELLRRISVGTLFILLLSTGIYFIFRRHAMHPIRKLIYGSERIAAGNLDDEISNSSNDELGVLSRAFNQMMHTLKKSQQQTTKALADLQELNKTLEQRVEERTHELEQANKQLTHIALYDGLTLLPNRTLFNDRLAQAVKAAEREHLPVVVMVLDLDRFKEVNDTLGHHMGDELLKDVARRLALLLRPTDTIARLGGDEFAILLPRTDSAGGVIVANKLLTVFETPFQLEGLHFGVLASIGFASYPADGEDMVALLKYADIAMYVAKQNRSGYFAYQKDADTHSTMRLTFLAELKHAIDHHTLELYFQPITHISDMRVVAVEALARWNHPERGFVPPDQFIPIIEQTGLVRNFTHWVIDSALAQWSEWRSRGLDIQMSVNLSMRNLQDREFPQQIRDLISKWQVPRGRLRVEVTESIIMSDPEHVMGLLTTLEQLGIQIAIDDFGTGYSSLSLLKRLPVHEIKIDRSFVMDMAHDKDDLVIVRSIIDLAHNLELKVVAEGIESPEIVAHLQALGCDMGQGYFISRPIPAATFEQWSIEKCPRDLLRPTSIAN